jgi:integrase
MKKYKKQWGYRVCPTRYPGIYQMERGGFLARARVKDPTGRQIEILRSLDLDNAKTALDWLIEEKTKVQKGSHEPPKKLFSVFAADLLDRKLARKEIKSASGESTWRVTLGHLISGVQRGDCPPVRGLGEYVASEIRPFHVETFKDDLAPLIRNKVYSPITVNGWLKILKVISKAVAREYETRDFMDGVEMFDTSEHATYTEEAPNSLPPERVPELLGLLRRRWPQHYAMVYVGFITGLRPSHLRPLRRRGPEPDVLWDQARLLVRKSETVGREMATTKTGIRYSIHLPPEAIDVLKWHVETQLTEAQEASDLLFPNEMGGYRAGSALQKPFKDIVECMGLPYKLTPQAMRRTFQDLARAAEVADIITRSVSGHATEAMQRHYSTVNPRERREGLTRVLRVIQGGAPDQGVGEVVGGTDEVVGDQRQKA